MQEFVLFSIMSDVGVVEHILGFLQQYQKTVALVIRNGLQGLFVFKLNQIFWKHQCIVKYHPHSLFGVVFPHPVETRTLFAVKWLSLKQS
jgi:hypothetical protein